MLQPWHPIPNPSPLLCSLMHTLKRTGWPQVGLGPGCGGGWRVTEGGIYRRPVTYWRRAVSGFDPPPDATVSSTALFLSTAAAPHRCQSWLSTSIQVKRRILYQLYYCYCTSTGCSDELSLDYVGFFYNDSSMTLSSLNVVLIQNVRFGWENSKWIVIHFTLKWITIFSCRQTLNFKFFFIFFNWQQKKTLFELFLSLRIIFKTAIARKM